MLSVTSLLWSIIAMVSWRITHVRLMRVNPAHREETNEPCSTESQDLRRHIAGASLTLEGSFVAGFGCDMSRAKVMVAWWVKTHVADYWPEP